MQLVATNFPMASAMGSAMGSSGDTRAFFISTPKLQPSGASPERLSVATLRDGVCRCSSVLLDWTAGEVARTALTGHDILSVRGLSPTDSVLAY